MKSSTVQQFILELLRQKHAHFTAHEIHAQILTRLPTVNLSTIYRALERLTQAGEISVSDMGIGSAVYEIVGQSPHHHLVCENCHKVITLENEIVGSLFDQIENQYDYQLTTNHLVLFGYCRDCSTHNG